MSGDGVRQGSANRQLVTALLAMAGVVAGLAVYVAVTANRDQPTATKAGPGYEEKVLGTAQGLLDAGQYGAARDLLGAYVRSNPQDVLARPMLAKAFLSLGDAASAERTIDDLLKLSPTDAQALWIKGELVAQRDGKNPMFFFKASADSAGASAQHWVNYAHKLLELPDEQSQSQARSYLDKAVRAGQRTPMALAGLGELALRGGDWQQAQELLKEAVEKDAQTLRLRAMLAEAQKGAARLDEAAVTLEEALALPDVGPVDEFVLRMALGDVCRLQRRWLQAGQAYAQACEQAALADQEPLVVRAAFAAADCYLQAGRLALALEHIEKARALRPEDPNIEQLRIKIVNEHSISRPANPS